MGDHDVAATGRRERQLARAGRSLRGGAAARSRRGRGAGAAVDAGGARTKASWRIPRRRSREIRRSWRSPTRTPAPSLRWSGCTSRPVASPICSRSTTRSCRSPRARPRSWRSASSSPASTKRRSSSRTRRSSSTPRSCARIPSSWRRCRRSIGCISSLAAGKSCRRRSSRRSICRRTWPPSRS